MMIRPPLPVCRRRPVLLDSLESRQLFAVTLLLDYSLDTAGFFNAPERRAALAAAAEAVTARLGDSLAAIVPSGTNTWSMSITHPATGGTRTFENPTVAAGTITIYAGARNLGDGTNLGLGGAAGYSGSGSQAWLDLLASRGQTGALANPATDTAPLGGSITFDINTNWHFGLTTEGLGSGKSDFLTVAQHELLHVLGFSSGNEAFTSQINAQGRFTGPKAMAVYGGPVPTTGAAHWAEGVISPGEGEAAMDPTATVGTRKTITALDLAALDDMGWDVLPEGTETVTPVATITGGTEAVEGTSLALSGASSTIASGSIVSYEWDTNYNGTFVLRATGADVTLQLGDVDGPATRTVALRVTSDLGVSSLITQNISVTNAAPTGEIQTTQDGGALQVVGVTDVAADLPGLVYRFDLGDDGTIEQEGSGTTFTLPVASSANDTRPIRVTITDKDGGQRILTGTVTLPAMVVNPPPPVVVTPDPAKRGKSQVVLHGTDAADTLALVKDAKKKLQIVFNGETVLLANSATRVVALLGGGNDIVNLGGLKVPVLVEAGDGDDMVITGKGKDVIIGGRGADVIRAGAGEDLLAGGAYADLDDASAGALLTAWNAKGKLAVRAMALSEGAGLFSATTVADGEIDQLFGDGANDLYLRGNGDVLPPKVGKAEIQKSR